MDKKNTTLGIICLGSALIFFFLNAQKTQRANEAYAKQQAQEALEAETAQPEVTAEGQVSTAISTAEGVVAEAASAVEVALTPKVEEQIYTLSNDHITVNFTNHGGAIKDVSLSKHKKELDSEEPVVFNDFEHPALSLEKGEGRGGPQEFVAYYELVSEGANQIVFQAKLADGMSVIRSYSITPSGDEEQEPYVIQHKTEFSNQGTAPLSLDNLYFSLGAALPTKGDILGEYQNFSYYDGEDAEFVKVGELIGSPGFFLGFGKNDAVWEINESFKPVQWASVKNQFFAAVLTPNSETPGVGYYLDTEELDTFDTKGKPEYALRGAIRFDLGLLAREQQKSLDFQYYVGPKEYMRLQSLGNDQDAIMQLAPGIPPFSWFSGIAKLLLIFLHAIHAVIPNWGWAIIVMTIAIKGLMWPLTAVQVKSSKRMAKIQAPMQELREKYKDDPQTLQKKTLELFRANKVNPAAGCLPLFVQLPIFLSLFYTLRTASELRFAPFLWVQDLSVADYVSWLPALPESFPLLGGPIHILPFLMTISMVFQMRLTPTPTTDNFQRKLFMFMPYIFFFISYRFPAGLVLYWTTQNLLTILQQVLTNRSSDGEEVVALEEPKRDVLKKGSSAKRKSSKKKK